MEAALDVLEDVILDAMDVPDVEDVVLDVPDAMERIQMVLDVTSNLN